MNNAKMWLVVKPTVGVPLFLTAVAVGSFAVHVAVLSKTNWYNNYLVGAPLNATAALQVEDGSQNAAYIPGGTQQVLVTMPDGTTARAILVMPDAATLN
ncbi:MAG: light-harvesting protein [Tabrizicola sp.]|uniref:light-harvesting protein n=1 Tax=Tabrizicola sp. TaxID=2005166 RepID=UPI002732855A|nr:light-harvesting protein [Tabrizicola sp.]MDP3262833.1 light-harvesting protein [Tabrizicola sp.]MDP3649030.1 light-harvesting protein [Paracoccaceae bacterium]MDZ4068779.1 light-harvesting protein [Tabrizicola sp.]